MTRPVKSLSLETAMATGPGEAVQSKGHPQVLLFVIARNVDTANDTVTVELEHTLNDGQDWDTIATISESDLDGETATATVKNVAVEDLRANLTGFSDAANGDLQVDAFVSCSGNPGKGYTNRQA